MTPPGRDVDADVSWDGRLKRRDSDADYTFGVLGMWLVAPDRHGAHNWEYTGHWTVRYHHLAACLSCDGLMLLIRTC